MSLPKQSMRPFTGGLVALLILCTLEGQLLTAKPKPQIEVKTGKPAIYLVDSYLDPDIDYENADREGLRQAIRNLKNTELEQYVQTRCGYVVPPMKPNGLLPAGAIAWIIDKLSTAIVSALNRSIEEELAHYVAGYKVSMKVRADAYDLPADKKSFTICVTLLRSTDKTESTTDRDGDKLPRTVDAELVFALNIDRTKSTMEVEPLRFYFAKAATEKTSGDITIAMDMSLDPFPNVKGQHLMLARGVGFFSENLKPNALPCIGYYGQTYVAPKGCHPKKQSLTNVPRFPKSGSWYNTDAVAEPKLRIVVAEQSAPPAYLKGLKWLFDNGEDEITGAINRNLTQAAGD